MDKLKYRKTSQSDSEEYYFTFFFYFVLFAIFHGTRGRKSQSISSLSNYTILFCYNLQFIIIFLSKGSTTG